MKNSNKRIFKNVVFLTLRMLLSVVISFYSTRIVLKELGVIDYGIYNVIGGVIAFLSFFNNAMSSSTQRHLSYEMGKRNLEKINQVFNASLRIYLILCLLFFLICETAGLYFFENKLNIPLERLPAARWVFHCVVLTFLVNILSIPFQAIINAKEDMHIIASIGIADSLIKLFIAIVLVYISFDKLEFYGTLLFATNVLIFISYFIYCQKKYAEVQIGRNKLDTSLYKDLVSFAGWTLFGVLGSVSRTQGLSILLNMFFGPRMNTVHGIATQLSSQITTLAEVVLKPFNPQIVQSYAGGDVDRTNRLSVLSSRYCLFLALIICIPLYLKTEFLLNLWLHSYPEETIIIVRLILINTVLSISTNPFITIMQATGNIRNYQIIIGSMFILNIPIAYIMLRSGSSYYSIFVSLIAITVITNVIKLAFVHYFTGLLLFNWIKDVLIRPVLVITGVVFMGKVWQYFIGKTDLLYLNVMELIYLALTTIALIACIGLSRQEYKRILQSIINRM